MISTSFKARRYLNYLGEGGLLFPKLHVFHSVNYLVKSSSQCSFMAFNPSPL